LFSFGIEIYLPVRVEEFSPGPKRFGRVNANRDDAVLAGSLDCCGKHPARTPLIYIRNIHEGKPEKKSLGKMAPVEIKASKGGLMACLDSPD
jgi:hypothetical protein